MLISVNSILLSLPIFSSWHAGNDEHADGVERVRIAVDLDRSTSVMSVV